MRLVTIVSAPKPFSNPHIAMIQRNAIRSWLELGDQVEVFLLGDEAGIAETAVELGVEHLPHVERSEWGTPLVNSIFEKAREASQCPLLVFVNADIIFTPRLLQACARARQAFQAFLLVGHRLDLEIRAEIDFLGDWPAALESEAQELGRQHPTGMDYFAFPKELYRSVPELAIGRAGWDNWMVFEAKRKGWPVIDGTGSVTAIHQQHDYSHLPGGMPHYRLEESERNVSLAGGLRSVYGLEDVDWVLARDGHRRAPWSLARVLRRLEILVMPVERRGLRWRLVLAIRRLKKAVSRREPHLAVRGA